MSELNHKAMINLVINLQDSIDCMEELELGEFGRKIKAVTIRALNVYESAMKKMLVTGSPQMEVYDIVNHSRNMWNTLNFEEQLQLLNHIKTQNNADRKQEQSTDSLCEDCRSKKRK